MCKTIANKYASVISRFDKLLGIGDKTAALAMAMALSEIVFTQEDDHQQARQFLFDSFFRKLDSGYLIQYQAYDFEVVDYRMQQYHTSRHFFRGPFPSAKDLATGNYVTVLGAAQLFGRFHDQYFPHYLYESGVQTPILNLSLGGGGPEYFNRPLFIDTVNRGRGCVVQVLSGRSVGTERFPGMRMTRLSGSTDELEDRLDIYSKIWIESQIEAINEVRSCQSAYMGLMNQLLDQIRIPVFMLWISFRRPSDWSLNSLTTGTNPDFGLFPQLVDCNMWDELSSKSSCSAMVLDETSKPKTFISRLTEQPCPVFSWKGNGTVMWSEGYYPNQVVHRKIATSLKSWLISLTS
jgi:hypothetical protein